MHVHNLRLFIAQQTRQLLLGVRRPGNIFNQTQPPQPGVGVSFKVGAAVGQDLVTSSFEQLPLLFEDHFFATGNLIAIMDEKYFHDGFGISLC